MDMPSCVLCYENVLSLHNEINIPRRHVIGYEDNNVFVLPDISPLCVGHMLIVSKRHINSFGNASEDVFSSIRFALNFLVTKVYRNDNILLFEHGAVVEHTAGSSIDHAHMHVLPLTKLSSLTPNDIDIFIKNSALVSESKIVADMDTLRKFAKRRQPYLFYYVKGQSWAYPVLELPSQFLRAFIAHHVHIDYDWKLNYKSNYSTNLYKQTLALFTSN